MTVACLALRNLVRVPEARDIAAQGAVPSSATSPGNEITNCGNWYADAGLGLSARCALCQGFAEEQPCSQD